MTGRTKRRKKKIIIIRWPVHDVDPLELENFAVRLLRPMRVLKVPSFNLRGRLDEIQVEGDQRSIPPKFLSRE